MGKKNIGRPSSYTEKVAAVLCSRIVEGEPLTKICREKNMPPVSTVYRWLSEIDSFRELYARAKEDQADTLADEIIAIADEPMMGAKTITKPNGDVETIEGDMIEHRKLRIDARKWCAAKLKPKRYGDRIEHTGGDQPIVIETPRDTEVARRIAWVLTNAAILRAQEDTRIKSIEIKQKDEVEP